MSLTSKSYIGKYNPTRSGGVYTSSGVDIGVADVDRVVVVSIVGGGIRNIASGSIAGVTATLHGSDQSGNGVAAIMSAEVPSGTTGDIIANATDTDFFENYFIVWTFDKTEGDRAGISFYSSDISAVDTTTINYTGNSGGGVIGGIAFQNGDSAKCPISVAGSFVRDFQSDFNGSVMGYSLENDTAGANSAVLSWTGNYSGEAGLITIPLLAAGGISIPVVMNHLRNQGAL